MKKEINIGFTNKEKIQDIENILKENQEITNIVYFTNNKATPLAIDFSDVEYRKWSDAILYRHYYPLLEKINNHTLLIFDEMLRSKNRYELTYNCLRHYANQTDNVVIFEWFPIINDVEDFMILLDLAYPYIYRGESFNEKYLKLDSVHIINRMLSIDSCSVWPNGVIPTNVQEKYVKEKEKLFDCIADRDPNTIPRALHLWCGTNCKKNIIGMFESYYIARNKRFKNKDVITWGDTTKYGCHILDFPVSQLQFNDYCKKTLVDHFTFWNSELSIDNYYFSQYQSWLERLGDLYGRAGV